MKYQWRYEKLGDVTYNVLPESQIKPFLMDWIKREWEIDNAEFPSQSWTVEWLELLPRMHFTLQVLNLVDITPRAELMSYKTPTYDFIARLKERAQEREISFLRGVSSEPLLVNHCGLELMDGYTRYLVFKKHKQEKVLVYVGRLND